jgi:nickel transport protein
VALRTIVLILCGCTGVPALAHGIRVFAATEGGVIEGRAYSPGGAGIAGATVYVFDNQDVALGETVTAEDGAFTFQATAGMDHRIVVESEDGHLVAVTVKAEELPAGADEHPPWREPVAPSSPNPADRIDQTPLRISPEALQAVVEKAVARQVRPLREALHAYESRVRWHDVLGGIGYILGVAGIVFYLLGRRPRAGES